MVEIHLYVARISLISNHLSIAGTSGHRCVYRIVTDLETGYIIGLVKYSRCMVNGVLWQQYEHMWQTLHSCSYRVQQTT